jgi:hypothetical protein
VPGFHIGLPLTVGFVNAELRLLDTVFHQELAAVTEIVELKKSLNQAKKFEI